MKHRDPTKVRYSPPQPHKIKGVTIHLAYGEYMRFCDVCSSRMRLSGQQYICSKCGNTSQATRNDVEVREIKRLESEPIHIINKAETDVPNVSRPCPKCGDQRAFHWFSAISGEHAGVKQERTIEQFRCTICQHTWTETR